MPRKVKSTRQQWYLMVPAFTLVLMLARYMLSEKGQILLRCCLEAQFCRENVHIGEGTVIEPHATIYHDVALGKRCLIHAGVSLGARVSVFIA